MLDEYEWRLNDLAALNWKNRVNTVIGFDRTVKFISSYRSNNDVVIIWTRSVACFYGHNILIHLYAVQSIRYDRNSQWLERRYPNSNSFAYKYLIYIGSHKQFSRWFMTPGRIAIFQNFKSLIRTHRFLNHRNELNHIDQR